VLDYFWTVHTSGRARNHLPDGTYVDVDYEPGATKHFTFAKDERKIREGLNFTKLTPYFSYLIV